MRSILCCIVLALPTLVFADDARYEIPTESIMAKSLTPSLDGVPANVEKSLSIKSISATNDDIVVLVKVGAIDTTRPKNESHLPDSVQNVATKNMIVKKYCSPFGNCDPFFDTLSQRNVTLHYHFVSVNDITFLSFNVSKADCD